MKTCDKCGKLKPVEEYKIHSSRYTSKITGKTRVYEYPDKTCNSCRKKELSEYMKEYHQEKTKAADSNAFWFSDDVRVWAYGPDKVRWTRIYQDKKEREELKTPWARI